MIVMFEPLPPEPWWAGALRVLGILPRRRDTVTVARGGKSITLPRGIPVDAPWWVPKVWEDWPEGRLLGMRLFVPYEARGPRAENRWPRCEVREPKAEVGTGSWTGSDGTEQEPAG